MDVAVVKLGVGNTASVIFALERLGATAVLTSDPDRVRDAERVILPGVGAAAAAMRFLAQSRLDSALRNFTRPLLGICLGQQLLYDRSEEGEAAGLGLISGSVKKLQGTRERPAPHMGWSAIEVAPTPHPLFDGVKTSDYAYFVHSYACDADDRAIATTAYGRPFAAAVAKGNVFGCQFHPERSGALGANVLRNFLAMPC